MKIEKNIATDVRKHIEEYINEAKDTSNYVIVCAHLCECFNLEEINQNQFLYRINAITRYYNENRRFPDISLIFDVIDNGFYIEHYLLEVFNHIFVGTYEEFTRCVKIYAYAVSNESVLLDMRYQQNMTYVECCSPYDCRIIHKMIHDYRFAYEDLIDKENDLIYNVCNRIYSLAIEHERYIDDIIQKYHGICKTDLFIKSGMILFCAFEEDVCADLCITAEKFSEIITVLLLNGLVEVESHFSESNEIQKYIQVTPLSLSIYPLLLNGAYEEFYWFARLWWRNDDFPEKIQMYFTGDLFRNSIPKEMVQCYIRIATKFANTIIENRNIVKSLIEWKMDSSNRSEKT